MDNLKKEDLEKHFRHLITEKKRGLLKKKHKSIC